MGEGRTIAVRALAHPFGAAEVRGLDPVIDLEREEVRALIRDALWQHGVLCVRLDSALDDPTARAVAAMIGPVKDPVGRTSDGRGLRYGEDRQVIDSGFVMDDATRAAFGDRSLGGDELRPGLFEFFHTDDSYVEQPALATVLHARALPKSGGDTRFLDMHAAFRALTPARQAEILGLRAVHAYDNGGAFPPRAAATGPLADLVDVAHPIVRAHPVSGLPALYFDLDRASGVAGLPVEEGRAILRSLQDHAETHAPSYRHRWQPHDVVIWDNARVQHRASGDFPLGEPRRFWRYLVQGPTPAAWSPS